VERALANLDFDYDLNNATPEFCVQLLNFPNLKMFSKLHSKIRSKNRDREWILDFIQSNGLYSLVQCVEKLSTKKYSSAIIFNSLVLSKCICCIKEVLNSKYGMECIINMANEHQHCLNILAKATSNPNQVVKKEIFQIFSAIAMYSEAGYALCLSMLEIIKVFFKARLNSTFDFSDFFFDFILIYFISLKFL
jgi:3-dehydroquinate dehydratase